MDRSTLNARSAGRGRTGIWLLLAALGALGCTAGFKSSALVGAQGAALSEHARATETALLCDFGRALLPVHQASCQSWTEKTADRKVALRILAGYGEALRDLSVLPDPNTGEAADGMLSALGALAELDGAPLDPNEKAAFKGALSGLVGFVSKAHRAQVITSVVRDADKPVASLVEALELQLELRDDYLQTLDAKLDGVLSAAFDSGSEARLVLCGDAASGETRADSDTSIAEPEPCSESRLISSNATDRLAFAEVRHHISILLEDNARARRSLLAFATAHRKLAEQSRRLKGEDAELARDLAIDLKAVYSALKPEENDP